MDLEDIKEYLKERIKAVEECYKKELALYQTEYGLNVSGLSRKEKEQVVNTRNCLIVQKECYKEILEKLESE